MDDETDETRGGFKTLMRAWKEWVARLEKEMGSATIHQWVHTLKIVRFDARNLFLEARDSIHVDWFEEHLRPRLTKSFVNNNFKPIRVHVSASDMKNPLGKGAEEIFFAIAPDRWNSEYTFENFVSSPGNGVAYKLLSAIDRPMFNPIYLYGPKNAGKTHLLTAAAIQLQKQGKRIFFVRAETFTSHVVQAIRLGHMQRFRKIYREIDALCVDDIDIFARKNATQEEFFHTFNTLHTGGKQLIFTATLPPSQLREIEPRLISRFEWGVSIGIEPSDWKAILEKKALLWGLPFSSEILQFLAERFGSDPLMALQALALREKAVKNITMERAEDLLKDLLLKEEEKALNGEKIIKKVAAHFGIKPDDLLGKSQTRECAWPRQVAMFLCREKLKWPFQKIGAFFGRDHSTVMASVKQVQEDQIQEVIQSLKS